MGKVRVLYLRTHHISTPVLRTVMWSPWSHCALIVEDEFDSVIDATFAHGVARRSLSSLLASSSKYEIKEIDCPDPKAAFDFLRSQIGTDYDTLGVLGIGLHRDWQKPDAWFCSELVEAALAAGGNLRFVNRANRVTPQHSWMVR